MRFLRPEDTVFFVRNLSWSLNAEKSAQVSVLFHCGVYSVCHMYIATNVSLMKRSVCVY